MELADHGIFGGDLPRFFLDQLGDLGGWHPLNAVTLQDGHRIWLPLTCCGSWQLAAASDQACPSSGFSGQLSV
jgi:hypothetical protein